MCLPALVILSLIFNISIKAQEYSVSEPLAFNASVEAFDQGEFCKALEGFSALAKRGQGSAALAYYTGRCYLELNEMLPEAIEYLYHAASSGGPADSRYYLAEAYRKDYNFQEAIRQYSRFEIEASSKLVKDLKVKSRISGCRSAIAITSTYNPYEVAMVAFMDLSDSAEYSQIRMKGGRLQHISSVFPELEGEGLEALVFVPQNARRGDYLYFVTGKSGDKNGLQLVRSKRGGGRWASPQELKSLNTEGDELLPYFDPIGKDLYFASNGRDGVGGFDLYRSHYDSDRDKWTEAINLGFPINSSADDYLLLPGNDLGMMMFFSNRQGTDSSLTVYRVHMVEPKKRTVAGDNMMLKRIASMDNVARDALEEYETLAVVEPDVLRKKEDQQVKYTEVRILEAEGEFSGRSSAEHKLLAEALVYQACSDSLKDLAMEARLRVKDSEDPNDRWVWQKQIMLWEKNANDEQDQADVLYARMGQVSESSPKVHTTVNAPEELALPVAIQEEPLSVGRFEVLSRTPYSESNPVPVGMKLPDGVFYRIQIGVFGQAVAPDYFGGISPLSCEILEGRGLVKYYAGKFNRYEDANQAMMRVRTLGYEDAFLVAWYNENPVPTQRAKQIELSRADQ